MARMKTGEDDSSGALRPTNSPRRIPAQNFYSFPLPRVDRAISPPFFPELETAAARSSFDIRYRRLYQFLPPLPPLTRLVKGLIDATRDPRSNVTNPFRAKRRKTERAFIPRKTFRERKKKRKEGRKFKAS